MARPTTLTDAATREIAAYVVEGSSIVTASLAAGYNWRTVEGWLRKGKTGAEPYATFVAEMRKAKAQWEARAVHAVNTASLDDWKAAAWMLERRTKEWRPPSQRQELTGKDGGPVDVRTQQLSDAEIEAELAAIAAKGSRQVDSED